jgi:acetyl-CoA acetyltransferase
MNQAVLRHAVICEPLRTPVGRYGGMFKDVPATTLAETVIRELVRRTGIQGSDIDDVVFGQCYPNGEAPAIGRIAALDAELGVRVPGLQIDRRCGSGLQAVIDAAMRVQTGVADLVVAGGVDSMSQAEHYVLGGRFGIKGDSQPFWDRIARGRITSGGRHHPVAGGMLETAIGRAGNVALASLQSVTLPSDLSATARYFETDVGSAFVLREGSRLVVPTAPGLGIEVDEGALRRFTLASEVIT